MSAIRVAERLGLVALLAIGLVAMGVGVGLGGLESRFSSASDSRGDVARDPAHRPSPPHDLDGTLPIRVRLSGRPPRSRHAPHSSPAVAGTWATHGDSEMFTPASTLDPCATYTLTIPAASTAVSHSPLGASRTGERQRGVPLGARSATDPRATRLSPLRVALLRAGARIRGRSRLSSEHGGATPNRVPTTDSTAEAAEPRPRYPTDGRSSEAAYAHESRAHLDRRIAAIDAFDPTRETPRSRIGDAPPLEYGQLDETTKGALMVFQSDHELEPTGEPDTATWTALLQGRREARTGPLHLHVRDGERVDPRDAGGPQGQPRVFSHSRQHGRRGRRNGPRHLPDLLALHLDHDDRHQPRRLQIQRPRRPLGQLLQRRRRRPRLPARLLRHSPIQRLRGAADRAPPQTVYGMLKIGDIVEVS